MRKYYVIHSTDPFLLARFSMELQMEGFNNEQTSIFMLDWHPFNTEINFSWLGVYKDRSFGFHNHKCEKPDSRLELDESNYARILNQVINNQ